MSDGLNSNQIFAKNQAALQAVTGSVLEDIAKACERQKDVCEPFGEEQFKIKTPAGALVTYGGGEGFVKSQGAHFYLLLGIGTGSVLKELLKDPAVKHVVVIEPLGEPLLSLLLSFDFSNDIRSGRVKLIGSSDMALWESEIAYYLREDFYRLTNTFNAKMYTEVGFGAHDPKLPTPEQVKNLFVRLAQEGRKRVGPNDEDCFHGLINTLRNFPDFYRYPRVENYAACLPSSMPGVLVSSGPSLKFTIDTLKKYQDKCVIFCVDTALKLLLEKGIVPDFVACIERPTGVSRVFEGMPELEHTALVAPSVVSPVTFKAFRGPKLSLYRQVGFDDWLVDSDKGSIIGGSASHLGYYALRMMGCESIYLLGQDLAYDSESGKMHVGGLPEWISQDILDEGTALGYDGKPKRTLEYWKEFAHHYQLMIHIYGGHLYHVLPVTYGIPIPQTERMDPDIMTQKFEQLPVVNKRSHFAHVNPKGFDLSGTPKKLKRIRDGLQYLAQQSILNMEKITEAYLDDDGFYDDKMQASSLNVEMEKLQAELLFYDNGFFNAFMLKLIGYSHANFGLKLAELFYADMNPFMKAYQQSQQMIAWYGHIFLWASRTQSLLERHNRDTWHFW